MENQKQSFDVENCSINFPIISTETQNCSINFPIISVKGTPFNTEYIRCRDFNFVIGQVVISIKQPELCVKGDPLSESWLDRRTSFRDVSRGISREHVALMFSQIYKEREDVPVDAGARQWCFVVGGRRSRNRYGSRGGAVLQRSCGIGGMHRPTLVPANVTDADAHFAATAKFVPTRPQGR